MKLNLIKRHGLGALLLSSILLIFIANYGNYKSKTVTKSSIPMQKNAVKTEVPINDIQIKIISAKEIARKTLEDPSQKRLNDELIAKISSEVENEQKAFDKATAEVEAENVKLSNLKDSLNSKILEGRPSEEIELENRKLEVQASLLINKQHEMNGAYKALMNAKDEIIQELIANK